MRNIHVFVVDKYSYPVHANRGFCGVKNPKGGGLLGVIADMKAYRIGDYVIFYHRRVDEKPLDRGFRDVFEIISDPFFDDTDVTFGGRTVYGKCPTCGSPHSEKFDDDTNELKCVETACGAVLNGHILPYRVLIKPVLRFDKPLDDNTAYIDLEDKGELPSLRYRKVSGAGRGRSAQHILPEEADKIIRLLKKVNNNRQSHNPTNNYISVAQAKPKYLQKTLQISRGSGGLLYYVKKDGTFSSETGLPSWLNENIDKNTDPVLSNIVGPLSELEYFGNNVPYGVGGENADLLLLHKKEGVRFKATIFELKKDQVNEDTVNQVLDPVWQNYAKWVGQLVTAYVEPLVHNLQIQPILLGSNVDQTAIDRIIQLQTQYRLFTQETVIRYFHGAEVKIRVLPPILLAYHCNAGNLTLTRANYTTMRVIR